MTPSLRKFALTAHVTFSVGWLGAVAGFLALAITGLTSQDQQTVRSTYISMELIAWFVIVPSNFGSLISGLVQSAGTKWGLFKHYWVLVKLILTLISTLVLLLHMQPISYLSDMASQMNFSSYDFREIRIQMIANAGAALVVLVLATTLSIYKPWGKTGYGMIPEQPQKSEMSINSTNTSWGKYVIYGLMALFLLVVIIHLLGGGLGGH